MRNITEVAIQPAKSQEMSSLTLSLKIVALIAAFFAAYYTTFLTLIGQWITRDDFSHGFLVAPISLYFVWADRRRIRDLPVEPCIVLGLFVTLSGGAMLLLGQKSSVVMAQQISILVMIPGLVLLLLGMRHLKALALPIAYLILMLPSALGIVTDRLSGLTQLYSAKGASVLLGLMHVTVFQHGNYIEMPNITLEVARECSGVNYLVSIIALGVPLAYFTQKTWVRKCVIVSLAVIVGLLANPLRIFLIALWGDYTGEVSHGPLHIFQALSVSVVGYVFLFLFAFVLWRIPSKPAAATACRSGEAPAAIMITKSNFRAASWMALVMLASLIGLLYLYNPKDIPLNRPLSHFPVEIEGWVGSDMDASRAPVKLEGVDDSFLRLYKNVDGNTLLVQIAYLESQTQGRELVGDKVMEFIDHCEAVPLQISPGHLVLISRAVIGNVDKKTIVLFWYDLNGRVVADAYRAKLFTAMDALARRRTNGALVIIQLDPAHAAAGTSESSHELDFTRAVLARSREFFPD